MADQKIASVRAKLQTTSADFQKLEGSMSRAIEARQRLDSQLQENEQVLKEFALLKDHNTVYKLTGPALVPQDATEAKSNVEKRLGFIKTEITRVEAQIKDHEDKVSKKRSEVVQLQQEFQALQPPSAQAA